MRFDEQGDGISNDKMTSVARPSSTESIPAAGPRRAAQSLIPCGSKAMCEKSVRRPEVERNGRVRDDQSSLRFLIIPTGLVDGLRRIGSFAMLSESRIHARH
jgi:hypothetical protein